jgi:hypothetical protein
MLNEKVNKMGLDMYLYAKRFFWSEERDKLTPKFKELLPDNKDYQVKEITLEVGYWRKANAIHKWFVDNCQDGVDECQETEVSRDKLKELLGICEQIVSKGNRYKAISKRLLPCQSGFFFGSTDYDEFYLQDIKSTIEILKKALELSDSYDFYYRSSW